MCNLSDGVEQKGIEKGIEKGIKIGIEQGIEQEHLRAVKKKLDRNKSIEKIAEDLEIEIADVEKYLRLIKENENM